MTPAARVAASSARQPEREVHVDGDGDAAISTQGLCDRLFAVSHVFFLEEFRYSFQRSWVHFLIAT